MNAFWNLWRDEADFSASRLAASHALHLGPSSGPSEVGPPLTFQGTPVCFGTQNLPPYWTLRACGEMGTH